MSGGSFLVVGLGNPGPKYARTRHNVGFMVIEELAKRHGVLDRFRSEHDGQLARLALGEHEVRLLVPLTYMNLSGRSVQKAAHFYRIAPSGVIVVHDEVDLPFGSVRIKVGGGAAGHNGIRSVSELLGTPEYLRIRVGIGRDAVLPTEKYVLDEFDAAQRGELLAVLEKAADAVESTIKEGAQRAMNLYNARR